ncbi:MAG: DUF4397 domain-containing protein [Wenzhouxiangella sp.]
MMIRSAFRSGLVLLVGAAMSSMAWADARVQIVHAAPFADTLEGTSVTVTANGAPVLEDFLFLDFTEYLTLPAGDYDLAVIPTGATEPAITASVSLESGVDYTVLAVGDGVNQDLALWALVDEVPELAADELAIRVVHAAPFAADLEATEVSIRTVGGDVVNNLVGVPYFAQSGFFAIPAGNYDLKVASNDGLVNFIDPLAVDLPAGLAVTVIAVGDGVNQPLGILALPVGPLETRTPVDNSVLGMWGSAAGGNEGFSIHPIPAENRLVGTAYTYALDGSGAPLWVTFDTCSPDIETDVCLTPGGFDGRHGSAGVFLFTGGTVAGEERAARELIGFVDFEFTSCLTATATLQLEDGTEVVWDLDRLTVGVPCTLD